MIINLNNEQLQKELRENPIYSIMKEEDRLLLKDSFIDMDFSENNGFLYWESFIKLIESVKNKGGKFLKYRIKNAKIFFLGDLNYTVHSLRRDFENNGKDNGEDFYLFNKLDVLSDIKIVFENCELIFINKPFISNFIINFENTIFDGDNSISFYYLEKNTNPMINMIYEIIKQIKSFHWRDLIEVEKWCEDLFLTIKGGIEEKLIYFYRPINLFFYYGCFYLNYLNFIPSELKNIQLKMWDKFEKECYDLKRDTLKHLAIEDLLNKINIKNNLYIYGDNISIDYLNDNYNSLFKKSQTIFNKIR